MAVPSSHIPSPDDPPQTTPESQPAPASNEALSPSPLASEALPSRGTTVLTAEDDPDREDDFQDPELELVEVTLDRSVDIDFPEPVSRRKPSLEAAKLSQSSHSTPEADRAIRMLADILKESTVPFEALRHLGEVRFNRSTERAIHTVVEEIEGGSSMSDAFGEHPRVFGKLFVHFVKLAEEGFGLRESLERYNMLRDELNEMANRPSKLSFHTRAFSLTAGTLLEMSGDVVNSLRFAAVERPRGLRKAVAEALVAINSGPDSISYCLREKGLFRSGFERGFLQSLSAGEDRNALVPTLLRLGRDG
ncbi:MAG: type II secretion system F family protein [Bdellovibrionales bacterium]|nr:type II secretion system F family protein [Bdellovibrionales bacterium]